MQLVPVEKKQDIQLIQWESIGTQIELAKDIEELTTLKNKLRAYQILAEQSRQSMEVQAKISIYKARADRKCGEWLKENVKQGGINEYNKEEGRTLRLSSIGVTRDESSRLQKIADIPDSKFEEILNTAEEETKRITNNMLVNIAKEAEKEERNELLKNKEIELPDGEFNVIYADPAWKYQFSETKSREIENQYPTMELEDIKNIKVPSAKDSVLYLWATAPKLEWALEVLNAWGFTYKTCAVWDKGIMGMGYWFRGQHELLLVGTKGNFNPPLPVNRVASVYRERRAKHSRKPKYYYDLIEKMCPNGKYLELFARNKYNEKWTVWGNEI